MRIQENTSAGKPIAKSHKVTYVLKIYHFLSFVSLSFVSLVE